MPPRTGGYCSFAGNVTYPKAAELREAARLVPDELILVETDSPFLAPQSHRGKRNEPALVVETAREVAAARRGMPATATSSAGGGERGARVPVVRLGQNFLADPNLLDAIVREAGSEAGRRGARGGGRRGSVDASGSPRR